MRALVLMLLCGTASAAPWTGILAPERAIDWTTVGIPGGIPVRNTQCGSTIAAGASAATIQAAIDAADPATCNYVLLGPGNFNNLDSIVVRKSITLRGSGTQQTFLSMTGSIGVGQWTKGGTTDTAWAVDWTGGLTRGSTQLTVTSTSGMVAGMTVILDEHPNLGWVHNMGYNGSCGQANTCGRRESVHYFYTNGEQRPEAQINKVVSVDDATHITVKDPIAYTHTAGLAPQVFWWQPASVKGNMERAGIENMSVDCNQIGWCVAIEMCDYCWIRNMAITDVGRAGAYAEWSYGFVIANNYLDSSVAEGPTMYGIEIMMSGHGLIENNILVNIPAHILPEASHGVVIAYNYAIKKTSSTPLFASFVPHLGHNDFLLWEGNVAEVLNMDVIWGSSSHQTVFRNRLRGTSPNKSQTQRALEIAAFQRYVNVVGNVLGDTSFHSQYSCLYASPDGTNNNNGAIYDISDWHSCQGQVVGDSGPGEVPNGPPYGTDPVTLSSIVRWGNWDAVTYNASGATHKGTRWCTGNGAGSAGADAYNSACTSDERGSDATFPPLANPSTTLPASLYNGTTGVHASCGTMLSFWKNPSSGYCPPYPPIGPDVACATDCEANAANHANKIPAQLCYEATSQDGSGRLTAFDPSNCYSADTGAKPNKPTGVH